VKSTGYEAPRYAIPSSHLFRPVS